jgi:hypothetical protein
VTARDPWPLGVASVGSLRRLAGGPGQSETQTAPGAELEPPRSHAPADPESPPAPTEAHLRLCAFCRQPVIPNPGDNGVPVGLDGSDRVGVDWDLEYRAHLEHDAMVDAAARFVGHDEAIALDAALHDQDPRYTGRHDLYWAAANHALLRATRAGDWAGLAVLYDVMARQAHDEEAHGPASTRVLALKREASVATLRARAGQGVSEVRITGCACSACARDQAMTHSVATELRQPTIPHQGCTSGYCTCEYAPVEP